jgi:hypothetical protein
MRNRLVEILQALAVIVGTALVAASVSRVGGSDTAIQLRFGVVGAILGAAALFIVWLLRSKDRPTGSLFADSGRYRGLKILFGGICVAAVGWLVAVYLSYGFGYWICVVGWLTGFVGLIVHFVTMLRATKSRDA